MRFGKINKVLLLGGSRCTTELAEYFINLKDLECLVFTAPRQLEDVIYSDGTTFEQSLKKIGVKYCCTIDINTCQEFLDELTQETLAIGLGEAWSFAKGVIKKLDGRLLDLMGIRLPEYRGGAHYTWQILRGNRIGACNLQVINEEMVQGVFDSGEIIYSKEYLFSESARIPNDYFNEAVQQEIDFIKDFIRKIDDGFVFRPFTLQENFSQYYPRLHTLKNAYLDWQWDTADIDRFICAFDNPYPGCSTFLNGERVHLKKSRLETNDGPFHPFQAGLVYKIYNQILYVASRQGTILIKEVYNEKGREITTQLKTGDRFHTPQSAIEKALTTRIEL